MVSLLDPRQKLCDDAESKFDITELLLSGQAKRNFLQFRADGDLISILVAMVPSQWRRKMISINFEPLNKTMLEVIEYMEQLEVLEPTEKETKDSKKKDKEKSENKNDKSKDKFSKSQKKVKKQKKRKRNQDSDSSDDEIGRASCRERV